MAEEAGSGMGMRDFKLGIETLKMRKRYNHRGMTAAGEFKFSYYYFKGFLS